MALRIGGKRQAAFPFLKEVVFLICTLVIMITGYGTIAKDIDN